MEVLTMNFQDLIEIAGSELQELKDELDEANLDQSQSDKDLQSQWTQTRMLIEPVVKSNEENMGRKIDNQKNEQHNLLNQLIELQRQHNILHSQISSCKAKVHKLRETVG